MRRVALVVPAFTKAVRRSLPNRVAIDSFPSQFRFEVRALWGPADPILFETSGSFSRVPCPPATILVCAVQTGPSKWLYTPSQGSFALRFALNRHRLNSRIVGGRDVKSLLSKI